MELLKVTRLTKTYGTGPTRVEALKNADFTMQKSEFAAIVGESGSGKTTLLNLIGALDTPTSGQILLNGQDIFSMSEQERTIFRRRSIGFIFQSFQLIPELTVEQNIIFPLLLDYQKPDPGKVWGSPSAAPISRASSPAASSSAPPSAGLSSTAPC